jgi:hypothetical protein
MKGVGRTRKPTVPCNRHEIIKIWGKEALTFGAVISLPASKADTITGGGALVVAEVVISRPAQIGTAGAVIMCIARDSVFVPHLGMRREMLFLRPVLPHVQKPLRC